MGKMSVDGERANDDPSQNQKRRRIGLVEREEHHDDSDDAHQVKAEPRDDDSYDEQDEEDDADSDDADSDDEEDEDEPVSKYCRTESNRKGKERSITVTLADPDVLNCSTCFDSLTIPVYQCEKGHFACSACRNRGRRCFTCLTPITCNRCKHFEIVLESIIMSCPNANYGCKETFSYSEKKDHKLKCIYAPCFCPHWDCYFVASSKELYLHFEEKHGDSGVPFSYYRAFSVVFEKLDQDEVVTLREKTHGNLFILHTNVRSVGTLVHISCIGPNSMPGYDYDISASSGGCNLTFNFLTQSIQRAILGTYSSRFLVIPYDFFGSSKPHKLKICIRQEAVDENSVL